MFSDYGGYPNFNFLVYLVCSGKLCNSTLFFRCELIAIGNGTGCRIIEKKISDCINSGFFGPDINVRYTIVNERGASIYSCSGIAKEEFPDLDPNLVSAGKLFVKLYCFLKVVMFLSI